MLEANFSRVKQILRLHKKIVVALRLVATGP